jgi:hypothetical protein
VKQSDLGEYEENARQKQNIQYTRQSTDSPSNQAIWMANVKFQTQEGSKQTTRFLNEKEHTPPKTKANHKLPLKPRQIKSSAKLNKRRQLPLKWRTQGFIK